jgi:hypothetical protein
MPRTAAPSQPPHDAARQINTLLELAMECVARDRGEATIRKWLMDLNVDALSDYARMCILADTILLSGDLLLAQPSASGATAFDRLARNTAAAANAGYLSILQKARFRLLQVAGPEPAGGLTAQDTLSGEALRIVSPDLPTLPANTALFARVAILEPGTAILAGSITPLDPAAQQAARNHMSAGALGVAANARWAEAVYRQVVRHGTLNIPGVNRPMDSCLDKEDDVLFSNDDNPMAILARKWAALGTAQPDADLLQRTREIAEPLTILVALEGAMVMREAGRQAMATALERMLLTLMETLARREHSGSGRPGLDSVANSVTAEIAAGRLPAQARAYFASLRLRLAGGAALRDHDDPALARLIQRIQGLRAKTVDQGCTEQEALAAADKVAELLDRYGLSLGEIDFENQVCNGIGVQTARRRFAPVDNCIPGIAEFFDCHVWLEQAAGETLRYVFFGLRSDVTAAEYLYALVERAFETETNAFRAGELYNHMEGARRTATNSFQIGLSDSICAKLNTMRQARETRHGATAGRDLVPLKAAIVDREVAKLGLNLSKRGVGGSKNVLSDAYAAGEEAGNRFEVTRGITQAA